MTKRLIAKISCVTLSIIIVICCPSGEKTKTKIGQDFLFVFDISRSVTVEDCEYRGERISRLEVAKETTREIVDVLPLSSRIGIATFAGVDASLLSMLTVLPPLKKEDHFSDIASAIDNVSWRNSWDSGSNLCGFLKALSDEKLDLPLTVVIFTDGGGEKDDYFWWPAVAESFKGNKGMKLFFVGVGDTKPSLVPDFDDYGKKLVDHFKNEQGEYFISALDENTLRKLSQEIGGTYRRLKSPDEFRTLTQEIVTAENDYYSVCSVKNLLLIVALIALIFSLTL